MGPRLIAAALVAGLFALPLLVALAPIDSGDAWWHLAVGARVLDTGELVTEEPFSHTAAGHPFTPQEWMSQVCLALADRAFGLTGVRLLTALLTLAGALLIWAFARLEGLDRWRSALLLALVAPAMAYLVEPRPHMFSFVALGGFALLALRAKAPSWAGVVAAGLLCAAWANFHAVAVLAPIVAGAVFAETAFLTRKDQREKSAVARRFGLLAASAIGVLANPSGYHLYVYALGNVGLATQVINEWQPFWFSEGPVQVAGWPAAIGATAAGALALVAVANSFNRREGRGCIQTLGLIYLVFSARRWLWLAWLPAFHGLRALPEPRKSRVLVGAATLALVVLPVMHPRIANDLRASTWSQGGASPLVQPLAAANFVRELELGGNLYHPYLWGGFLLYWLQPEWKPYLYGETAVFMESGVLQERQRVELGPEDEALQTLERRSVRAIVLPRMNRETKLTRPPGGDGPQAVWIRVFANTREVVWVRRTDAEALAAARDYYAALGIRWNDRWGYLEHEALLGNLDWCRLTDQLHPDSDWAGIDRVVNQLLAQPDAPDRRQALSRILGASPLFRRSLQAFEAGE